VIGDGVDDRADNRCRCAGCPIAGDGVPDGFDRDAVLQAKAQRHRGVSCDGLHVTAGLAAVDEDLARRAVGVIDMKG
jgi:hypothetical protein